VNGARTNTGGHAHLAASTIFFIGKMTQKRDIEPVVTKRSLGDRSSERDDVRYWMAQSPQARIDQVERLRAE
jgi:hypothetical protein